MFAERVLAAETPMAQTLNFAYCFVSHPAWVIGHVHQAEGPECTLFLSPCQCLIDSEPPFSAVPCPVFPNLSLSSSAHLQNE